MSSPAPMPCLSMVSAMRASARAGPFGSGQHPPGHVAAVDVDDRVQVVVGPLGRAVELGDVPAVDLVGSRGHQLGFHLGRVGGMASAVTHLVVLAEDPVHGGDRTQVDALVEELGVDGGRRLVCVLGAVEDAADLLPLDLAEGPGLGGGHPLGLGWGRGLAVPAVVTGPALTERRAGGPHPDHRRQFVRWPRRSLRLASLVRLAVGGELLQQRREFSLDLDDLPGLVQFAGRAAPCPSSAGRSLCPGGRRPGARPVGPGPLRLHGRADGATR